MKASSYKLLIQQELQLNNEEELSSLKRKLEETQALLKSSQIQLKLAS